MLATPEVEDTETPLHLLHLDVGYKAAAFADAI